MPNGLPTVVLSARGDHKHVDGGILSRRTRNTPETETGNRPTQAEGHKRLSALQMEHVSAISVAGSGLAIVSFYSRFTAS